MKRTILILILLVAVSATIIYSLGNGETYDESETYRGVEKVDIFGETVDVEIIGGSSNSIDLELIQIPESYTITHTKNGSTLNIRVISGTTWFSGNIDPRMELSVPDSVDIDIENSTGDVIVENIEGKNFNIVTSTGDIQLNDISTNINVKSTTGDMEFDKIDGDIKAKSSTGGQDYSNIFGDINAESSTGDKTLYDVKGKLDLTSSTGSITGKKVELTDDSNFRTSTGDINLDLINDMDDFSFDMTSSTGDIQIEESKGSGKLKFGNGSIKITAESSTGEQTIR